MKTKKKTPAVCINVLPGQPTDGSGSVCIHLFVQDKTGPITEPSVLHPAVDDNGQPIKNKLRAIPTRGRLACDPKKTVAPVVKNGVTYLTLRTDVCDAVTCIKCKQTKEYKELKIATTVQTDNPIT